jgi:hypothetical protein
MGETGDRRLPADIGTGLDVPRQRQVLAVGGAGSTGASERRPILRLGGESQKEQQPAQHADKYNLRPSGLAGRWPG